jgi:hypothetical protein
VAAAVGGQVRRDRCKPASCKHGPVPPSTRMREAMQQDQRPIASLADRTWPGGAGRQRHGLSASRVAAITAACQPRPGQYSLPVHQRQERVYRACSRLSRKAFTASAWSLLSMVSASSAASMSANAVSSRIRIAFSDRLAQRIASGGSDASS